MNTRVNDCHSRLNANSCTFVDSGALSSTLNMFKMMRVYNDCRATLVANYHPNLDTQLSSSSHHCLTARTRVEQNFHPHVVTQLSHNSNPRLTARIHESCTKLSSKLGHSTII